MPTIFHHKVMVFLLALALFATSAPKTVNASPAQSDMAMEMMNCHEQMPAQDHQMPCDDGSACLGMLGCAMAAVAPATAVAPAEFLLLESSWPAQPALDGLVRRPALPPPIA